MNLQRFPRQRCLQARPKQTTLGHEELFGPTELGRLGAHGRYPKHCSSLQYGPDCLPHKLNSAALYVLLLPGRRRHQVRNHGHRTLGIAVHRPCLFQPHHHRCSLDRFSCVHLMGGCYHTPTIDICWRFADPAMAEGKSSPDEFARLEKRSACPRRMSLACLR
jgi:hypothetical protein